MAEPEQEKKFVQKAEEAFHQYLYQRVIEYAGKGLGGTRESGPPRLYELYALALERMGLARQSARVCDQCLEKYGNKAEQIGISCRVACMKSAIMSNLQEVRSARESLEKWLMIWEDARILDFAQKAMILITLGNIISHGGDQRRAEELFLNAESLLKGLEDCGQKMELEAGLRNGLALVRFRQGKLFEALELCENVISEIKVEHDLNKAEAFRHKAVVLSIRYNYIGAIESHSQALKIYRRVNYSWGLMKEYISLGLTYLNMGEVDLAELFFHKAGKLIDEMEDKTPLGVLYSRLGHLYMVKGDLKKALDYHRKDLSLARGFENSYVQAFPLRNVGRLMRLSGRAEESIPHLVASVDLFMGVSNELNAALSMIELVLARLDLGEAQEVQDMAEQAAAILRRRGQDVDQAQADLVLGIVNGAKGHFDAARDCFQACIEVFERYENRTRLAEAYFHFGSMEAQAGESEKAVFHFTQALKFAAEIGNRDLMNRISKAAGRLDGIDDGLLVETSLDFFRGGQPQAAEGSEVGNLLGRSDGIGRVREQIMKVAPTGVMVLIRGESGTGKELAARAIHRLSSLNNMPFITVNCAAIPRELVESELFGYRRGAFTGAVSNQKGKLVAADGGTVFLDEIGDLPLEAQSKLLRFLQDGEVQELGAVRGRRVSVRVILATNCDLERAVRERRFREDLFNRVNGFQIFIPPLRDRKEDIPVLADYFLGIYCGKMGRETIGISKAALEVLTGCSWSIGNVRELEKVMERAVILCDGDLILPEHLPREITAPEEPLSGCESLLLDDAVRSHVLKVLRLAEGCREEAARLLGIHRNTLRNKLIQWDLDQ